MASNGHQTGYNKSIQCHFEGLTHRTVELEAALMIIHCMQVEPLLHVMLLQILEDGCCNTFQSSVFQN